MGRPRGLLQARVQARCVWWGMPASACRPASVVGVAGGAGMLDEDGGGCVGGCVQVNRMQDCLSSKQ